MGVKTEITANIFKQQNTSDIGNIDIEIGYMDIESI